MRTAGNGRRGRANPGEDHIRTRRYTRQIAAAFGLSGLSSVGLTIVYARGGSPPLEGALLLLSLGGLGLGFLLWGRHLMPHGPFVEERVPMASDALERTVFQEDWRDSRERIGRRAFLGRMLLWALGALGIAAILPVRSLGPSPGRSLVTTAWRRGLRVVTPEGTPVRATDMGIGGVLTVFPEGHAGRTDSQVILLRLEQEELTPVPGREDWTPQGYLGFSKICTHAGCPVGLYEERTNRLFCPCHQSVFDVLRGARPTAGPATRPLPQLPLAIDGDGFLVARGDFSDPVGPGWWGLPEPTEGGRG